MPLSSSSVAPSILMEYGFMHTFAYCCLSRKRWLALCTLCASLIRESTKGSFWFDAVIRFMIKIKDTDKKKEYAVGLTHFWQRLQAVIAFEASIGSNHKTVTTVWQSTFNSTTVKYHIWKLKKRELAQYQSKCTLRCNAVFTQNTMKQYKIHNSYPAN